MYKLRVGLLSEIENTPELTQELVDFITMYEGKEIYIHPEYKEDGFLKVSRYAKKQSFIIPDYWVEEVVENNSFDFKSINQNYLMVGIIVFTITLLWFLIPNFTQEEKIQIISEYQNEIDLKMKEKENQINEEALYQIQLNQELDKSKMKVSIYEKEIEKLRKEKFTINFK